MSNNGKLNRKRTGLPGGKVPKNNRYQGHMIISGGATKPGIRNLPDKIARMFY